MAKKRKSKKPTEVKLTFRFPLNKLPLLDAYVKHQEEAIPGRAWTRSGAGLNLALQKLEEEKYRIGLRPKRAGK